MTSDTVNIAFFMKILPKHLSTAAGVRKFAVADYGSPGGTEKRKTTSASREKYGIGRFKIRPLGMSGKCGTYRRGAG